MSAPALPFSALGPETGWLQQPLSLTTMVSEPMLPVEASSVPSSEFLTGLLPMFVPTSLLRPDSFATRWRTTGAPIPLEFLPPPTGHVPPNCFNNDIEEETMGARLMTWLAAGVVSTWSDHLASRPTTTLSHHVHVRGVWTEVCLSGVRPYTLSPMFFVPKKPDGLRDILNLSIFNQAVTPQPFKNEPLHELTSRLQSGDFLYSVDLKDAYWSVRVHWSYRPFLGFCFRGKFFVWNSLPFGLASAPWTFVKMLRPTVERLRLMGLDFSVYMDDFAGRNRTMQGALQDLSILRRCLEEDGWTINLKKSIFIPSFELTHLGFLLRTEPSLQFPIVSIPPTKIKSIRSLIRLGIRKRAAIPARLLASIIGSARALSPALPQAAIYLRPAYVDLRGRKHWASMVSLSVETCEQLELLRTLLGIWNGARAVTPPHTLVLYTDASGAGWGAWTALSSTPELILAEAAAFYPHRIGRRSSNFRELYAVLQAVDALRSQIQGHAILLMTDNMTTMSYTNKYGGKLLILSRVAQALHALLLHLGCTIEARHIPGVLNVHADALSRRSDRREEDWRLNPTIFSDLDRQWGPHDIDRFASARNTQLPRFNSHYWDVGTEAVNAFDQCWTSTNSYMNPPFSLIGQVLDKIRHDRASVTLIVPVWVGRPWWPRLMLMSSAVVLLPRRADLFLRGQASSTQKLSPPSWQAIACRISSGGY